MSNSPDVLTDRARWLKRARPFPDQHRQVDYRRTFSAEQARRLLDGFNPRDMDDKWFITPRPGSLDFHRSWTGIHIYRLLLRATREGVEAGPLLVNADPDQFGGWGHCSDADLVNGLIDRRVLN